MGSVRSRQGGGKTAPVFPAPGKGRHGGGAISALFPPCEPAMVAQDIAASGASRASRRGGYAALSRPYATPERGCVPDRPCQPRGFLRIRHRAADSVVHFPCFGKDASAHIEWRHSAECKWISDKGLQRLSVTSEPLDIPACFHACLPSDADPPDDADDRTVASRREMGDDAKEAHR